MLKSERNNQRETTETNALCELLNRSNRFSSLICKHTRRKGGGAFISQRFTLEWSFCTSESERKENYSQTLAVSAQL